MSDAADDSRWTVALGAQPHATPEALAEFHARCFPQGGAWSVSAFASTAAAKDVVWATALTCERVLLGFAAARLVVDEVELLTICRSPNWSGQGLGSALLSKVVAESKSRGGRTMFLEVARSNLTARRLYAAYGFESIGVRQRYYPRSDRAWDDAIVLRTRLG